MRKPARRTTQDARQFSPALPAALAALTAIFAKIGVETIDSDLATFPRTCVLILSLLVFVTVRGSRR